MIEAKDLNWSATPMPEMGVTVIEVSYFRAAEGYKVANQQLVSDTELTEARFPEDLIAARVSRMQDELLTALNAPLAGGGQ